MIKNSALGLALAACLLASCNDHDDNNTDTSNQLPTVDAGIDQSVNQATIVTLSGSGADAEGAVSYTWLQTQGTTVFLSDSSAANPSFTVPNVPTSGEFEVLVFELTVMDDQGFTATDSVSVTVFNRLVVSNPPAPGSVFFDGNLIGADYWSEVPEILSAGFGFADIVGVPAEELSEALVRDAGGAWLSDISCGDDVGAHTRVTTQAPIGSLYIQQTPYGELKDGAIGLDGLPIVFSWPLDTRTLDISDFKFTLNTGEVVFPLAIGPAPNIENNERNVAVVFGEFGNRKKSSDPESRFPVKLEIVDDGSPVLLVGPDNQVVSAVGMSWETSSSPYDENNGPKLVGAKLNHVGEMATGEGVTAPLTNLVSPPNDEFVLYGGGDFRLRVLTSGGFSPDGVRRVLPTDYEKFFRIHVRGEDGATVLIDQANVDYTVQGGSLKVIGLADLGSPEGGDIVYGDCYREDADNYIDVILVGDEAAARNITHIEIPSLAGGYAAFYNPGGPGTTPFTGVTYTSPGPADLEPVTMALDNPMRVTRIVTGAN